MNCLINFIFYFLNVDCEYGDKSDFCSTSPGCESNSETCCQACASSTTSTSTTRSTTGASSTELSTVTASTSKYIRYSMLTRLTFMVL